MLEKKPASWRTTWSIYHQSTLNSIRFLFLYSWRSRQTLTSSRTKLQRLSVALLTPSRFTSGVTAVDWREENIRIRSSQTLRRESETLKRVSTLPETMWRSTLGKTSSSVSASLGRPEVRSGVNPPWWKQRVSRLALCTLLQQRFV